MIESLAITIANAITDPNALREVVACAAHDIIMRGWQIGGIGDPRRLIEEAKMDILADDFGQFEFTRLVEIGELIANAVIGRRLHTYSQTMTAVRTMIKRGKPQDACELNRQMVFGMAEAIAATGTTSPLFESVKDLIRSDTPQMEILIRQPVSAKP